MNLYRALLGGGLCFIAAAGIAGAVTWTVDDDPGADFTSVQDAITAAMSGDIIQVSCGIYFENIQMKDGVKVLGEGADCTVLDGSAVGTVVTFVNVGATTELSGFTIRNGLAFLGAGIYIDSPATISHSIITGNAAIKNPGGFYGVGGGIEIYDAGPMITNNLFVGNTAERSGAALDIYFSYPFVINNTIVGNDAIAPGASVGFGGGIYSLFSSPTVMSNIIYDNLSEVGGGGMDMVQSTYAVEFNVLDYSTTADAEHLASIRQLLENEIPESAEVIDYTGPVPQRYPVSKR